jgi:hypothetical protein
VTIAPVGQGIARGQADDDARLAPTVDKYDVILLTCNFRQGPPLGNGNRTGNNAGDDVQSALTIH